VKKLKAKNLVPISDSIIYIMSDGVNSKIGITTNLQNRVSTYKIHNPTATLFSHYICSKAKDIELAIKTLFKDKTITSSKEWFNLNPNYLDRIVSLLVHGENNTHLDIIPAKGKIEVPLEYLELRYLNLDRIVKDRKRLLEDGQRLLEDGQNHLEDGQNHYKKWEEEREREKTIPYSMLEIISKYFNLGIPEHKLPKNIFIDSLGLDPYESITDRTEDIYNTQNYKFYSLVDTEDKKQVSICNAIICVVEKKEKVRYQQISYDCGFFCLEHQEWVPADSKELTLLVIMWKTPLSVKLSLWQNSFKKWVIENQSYISSIEPEFLSFCQKNNIVTPPMYNLFANPYSLFLKDIERLPLHLNDFKDIGKYIRAYIISSVKIRVDFLFAKWKGVDWIPRIDPVVDEDGNEDDIENDVD
jgi:hypothetical protein